MSSITPETLNSPQETSDFPVMLRKAGNVVRIFRGVSKSGYTQYTVSYYQFGKRQRESLADEQEARKRARSVLNTLVEGEVEATNMRLQDVKAYTSAMNILAPTGVSLETACREFAQAFDILKNRASLVRAAQDYSDRLEEIVSQRSVDEVVTEFLTAKEQGRATKRGGKHNEFLEELGLPLLPSSGLTQPKRSHDN